ncbi:diguanylate cyclase [bacterium]|nr:diguanylate cyclase [bacterium]
MNRSAKLHARRNIFINIALVIIMLILIGACVFLGAYALPWDQVVLYVSIAILLVVIALLMFLIKKINTNVVKMMAKAKMADDPELKEIGIDELGVSLDKITKKLRGDMSDLYQTEAKISGLSYEINRLLEKTNSLTITDKLTGLYNLKYYEEYLNEELKRAAMYERPCSIIGFDVDNLDVYLKKLGGNIKNKVLKKIAGILRENARDIDKIARCKDTIFCIIFPEINKKEAYALAEKIRKAVANESIPDAKSIIKDTKITVSAGIVANPVDGDIAEELNNKLYRTIKQSKEEGGNRVTMFPTRSE